MVKYENSRPTKSSVLVSGWEGTDSQFLRLGPISLESKQGMGFGLSIKKELLAARQWQAAILTFGHRWISVIKCSGKYQGARQKLLLSLAHSSQIRFYLNTLQSRTGQEEGFLCVLFPVRKSTQGNPCFHYRDGFAVLLCHHFVSTH